MWWLCKMESLIWALVHAQITFVDEEIATLSINRSDSHIRIDACNNQLAKILTLCACQPSNLGIVAALMRMMP